MIYGLNFTKGTWKKLFTRWVDYFDNDSFILSDSVLLEGYNGFKDGKG